MAEESKRRRKPEEMEEDRISNLPDGVLNHILSFLPTKTAVATAHLSRRWRHLWKYLSVLNFSDDSHEYVVRQAKRFKNFALFIYGVLALLRNPRAIQKMTLDCGYSVLFVDKFRAYSVQTWVLAVIGPHLQELNLHLDSFKDISQFKLPQTLFTSTNLVSLSLSGGIHVHIQRSTEVSLPSLKMLLINIGNAEVSSMNALFYGCPVIETLDLCFSADRLDTVCIPTSLKRLRIAIENDVGACLEINAPDLEYLHTTRITFGHVFSMYNLHNVVEAYLDLFAQSFGSVIPLHNLLGALSKTEELLLSPSTTKWLLGQPHDLRFQEFQYLRCLGIVLPWFNSNSLLTLLQKCPMLQDFTIHSDWEQSPILGWAPQSTVPNCLVSHLTFIQYDGFLGSPDEVSFVEYVLQKGLVLEKILITADRCVDQEKNSILKTLSNVPRASGICQLTFD